MISESINRSRVSIPFQDPTLTNAINLKKSFKYYILIIKEGEFMPFSCNRWPDFISYQKIFPFVWWLKIRLSRPNLKKKIQ